MKKNKNSIIIVFIFHSHIIGYLYTINSAKHLFKINYQHSNFHVQKDFIISKIKNLYKIKCKIILYPSQDIEYQIAKKEDFNKFNNFEQYDIIENNKDTVMALKIQYFVHYITDAISTQFAGFLSNISFNDIFIKKITSNIQENLKELYNYSIIFTINSYCTITVTIYHIDTCIYNYNIDTNDSSSSRIIAGYIEQEIEDIISDKNLDISYKASRFYIISDNNIIQYFSDKYKSLVKNIVEYTNSDILKLCNIQKIHNTQKEDLSSVSSSKCTLEYRDISFAISKNNLKLLYTKRDKENTSLNTRKTLLDVFFIFSFTVIFIALSIKSYSLFDQHIQNNEYKHKIIRFDLPIITHNLEKKILNKEVNHTKDNYKISKALDYITDLEKYNFSKLEWKISNTNNEVLEIEIMTENKNELEKIEKNLKEIFLVNDISMRENQNKIFIIINF